MARIPISDLYLGEGLGEKYGGILNAVMQEVITNGVPEGCDERTWIELLTVKQTFLMALQMAEQGDEVSELTDAASPCSMIEKEEPFGSGAHLCATGSLSCSGAPCAPRNPLAERVEEKHRF